MKRPKKLRPGTQPLRSVSPWMTSPGVATRRTTSSFVSPARGETKPIVFRRRLRQTRARIARSRGAETEPLAEAERLEEQSRLLRGRLTSLYGLRDEAGRLKTEDESLAWLGTIYSQVLQAVAFRVTSSVRAWDQGIRGLRPDRPGFPACKRWSARWFSILAWHRRL